MTTSCSMRKNQSFISRERDSSPISGTLGTLRTISEISQMPLQKMGKVTVVILVGLLLLCESDLGHANKVKVKLLISHWNDVNGMFDPIQLPILEHPPLPCHFDNQDDPDDPDHDLENDLSSCTGGFGSLVTLTKNTTLSKEYFPNDHKLFDQIDHVPLQNRLRLQPGNFLGADNGWLSILNDGFDKFLKLSENLEPTATALGYEDLRYGWKQGLSFYKSPTIISNMDHSTRSRIAPSNSLKEFLILRVRDSLNSTYPLGLLGFVDPLIKDYIQSDKGTEMNLKLYEVIPALKSSVEKAKSSNTNGKYDLKTFIVLGDCDLALCKKILDQIPEVKVVVTGTLNKTYPFKHKQGLILSAGEYGSSVGHLVVSLDPLSGEIVSVSGQIFPNLGLIEPDYEATEAISELRKEVINLSNKTGMLEFGLDSKSGDCLKGSCTLGNVVADAMARCVDRHQLTINLNQSLNLHLKHKPILALWHGAAITKTPLKLKPFEEISDLDVHKWLPYMEKGQLVLMKGYSLQILFEKALIQKEERYGFGTFLHVSHHLRVYLKGDKVSLKIISEMATSEDLDVSLDYLVIIPQSVLNGLGPFKFFKDFKEITVLPFTVGTTCLQKYIEKMELLSWGFESRTFLSVESGSWTWLLLTLVLLETTALLLIFRDVFLNLYLNIKSGNLYPSFTRSGRRFLRHRRLIEDCENDTFQDFKDFKGDSQSGVYLESSFDRRNGKVEGHVQFHLTQVPSN